MRGAAAADRALPREVRGAAERHAPGDRGRGAHAPPRRRARVPWETAWDITRRTFGYTNHTLMPEALECWPLELFQRILPRHLEIIFEINARFLDDVRAALPRRRGAQSRALSLIDEHGERYVRMAHLACVGSHAINGVAALHSELLEAATCSGLPRRCGRSGSRNKTNGVTPRRWLVLANPRLAQLHHETHRRRLGTRSRRAAGSRALRRRRGVPRPLARHQARQQGRARSARRRAHADTPLDPDSLFDVQVKRIHEYKRQHLNMLHVIALYHRLKSGAGRARPAAHLHLRRQSGARVSPRETDHQAHQRRRRSRRTATRATRDQLRVAVPAELQRQQRAARLSGRRSLRADLDGRQGSVRHGQHEVRA